MNLLTFLQDIWDNLVSIVTTMTLSDYFEIAIISFCVYFLLKLVRETRAEQLVKGIIIVAVILLLIRQLNLKALSLLSDTFFNVGAVAIIVMFQPELRRVLEKMGRVHMRSEITFNENSDDPTSRGMHAVEEISAACEKLSRSATGALIVFERTTKLGEQIVTGTILSAKPSVELIGNIFFPNTPLHDGALIIRDGMLHAAGCFLPKPSKEELISKELGSRHRAAIGMSEVSDAIVVVVSEETGMISVAENGVLKRGFTREKLRERLIMSLYGDLNAQKERKQKSEQRKQKSEQRKELREERRLERKNGGKKQRGGNDPS
jgi:diadenylate cyclase